MIAVIFEVWPADDERREQYLDIAASLRADLAKLTASYPLNAFKAWLSQKSCCLSPSGVTKRP